MNSLHAAVALTCTLASFASAQAGKVERLTHGDTTIVRTTGNGLWGAPKVPVEVLRIGGDGKEAALGRIGSVAALPDGGVIFYDAKGLDGPVIRIFDRDGKFVKNVSRIGSGPGEYRGQYSASLYVGADNRIYLFDPSNARTNVYSAAGDYLYAIPVLQLMFSTNDMIRPAAKGGIFLRVASPMNMPGKTVDPLKPSYVRIDSSGHLHDSLPAILPFDGDAAFQAAALANGQVVVPNHERVALLFHPAPGGRGMRVAELGLPRAPYSPEERAAMEAPIAQGAQGRSGAVSTQPITRPPPPPFKDAFAGTALEDHGRVWIARSATAVTVPAYDGPMGNQRNFRVPIIFDAFQPDGTFLGEVTFPVTANGLHIYAFSGEFAWGTLLGKDDEQYLVKYRIPGITKP